MAYQVRIDRSRLASKQAVAGRTEDGRLSCHRPSRSDKQIRLVKQIWTTDGVDQNPDSRAPLVPPSLGGRAGNEDDFVVACGQPLEDHVEEPIGLAVIQGALRRGSDNDQRHPVLSTEARADFEAGNE